MANVRWKDKTDIGTLAAGDRMPVTDVSDANTDKHCTLTEIATFTSPGASATVAGVVELAEISEYRDNTPGKALMTDKVWGALAAVAKTSSGGSIAIDLNTGLKFTHTFTENTTLANPANKIAGKSWSIEFTQHASAPKTLAFGTDYTAAGKAASLPTITASNSAKDTLHFECLASGKVLVAATLDHD